MGDIVAVVEEIRKTSYLRQSFYYCEIWRTLLGFKESCLGEATGKYREVNTRTQIAWVRIYYGLLCLDPVFVIIGLLLI